MMPAKKPGDRQFKLPIPGHSIILHSAPCTKIQPHFYALYQNKETNCIVNKKYSIIN